MIRVVLAEDQKLLLGAIGALLELEPDIEIVGRTRRRRRGARHDRVERDPMS